MDKILQFDNIFIDTNVFTNFKIIPIINELSDHNAQLLIIGDLHMHIGTNYIKSKTKMDGLMLEFQIRLSSEVWENVFNTHNNNNNNNNNNGGGGGGVGERLSQR